MKEYDIYLFDFDGTLFDSLESLYPTFRYAFDAVGFHDVSDEEIESYTHISLDEMIENSYIPPELKPLFLQKILEALDFDEFLKLIKPFPEAIPTLKELQKRGKRLAIVSNNDSEHIRKTLELLNVDVPFDAIVGSDMVQRSKPHPDVIFVAFDIMGVKDASRAVYVGDSIQDGETGLAAGIGSIVVDRRGIYEKVRGEKVSSLSEILNY